MDEHEAAWQRAELLLVEHAKMSKSEHHPYDDPDANIQRLLTDLMHYCHERNNGKTFGSSEYLEFFRIVESAREQFIKEREAVPEIHEPALDPNRPKSDPAFEDFQKKLYSRQLAEREDLERKHRAELNHLGESKQLFYQHLQEIRSQANQFEKERERYTNEYREAKRIAVELEKAEKQNTLDLAQGKNNSRSS